MCAIRQGGIQRPNDRPHLGVLAKARPPGALPPQQQQRAVAQRKQNQVLHKRKARKLEAVERAAHRLGREVHGGGAVLLLPVHFPVPPAAVEEAGDGDDLVGLALEVEVGDLQWLLRVSDLFSQVLVCLACERHAGPGTPWAALPRYERVVLQHC